MSFPSLQNHPQASLAKPEPTGSIPSQLASWQCTPKPSDPLASHQHIPNPTLLQPSLFIASSQFLTSTLILNPTLFNLLSSCIKFIPNNSSVSWLWSGEAQSHISLTQYVLVCLFSLSIYLFLLLSAVHFPIPHCSLPSAHFLCLTLSSPSPLTLVSSIFILSFCQPYFSYPILSLWPIPDCSDQPDPYHT